MIYKTDETRRGRIYAPIGETKGLPEAPGVKILDGAIRFSKADFPTEYDCEKWLAENSEDTVMHVKAASTPTKALKIDEAEWQKILKFVVNPEKVSAGDLAVYRSWLANNVMDRDRERFTKGMLEQFAATTPGKTKLMNHDQFIGTPYGRYYAADVVEVTVDQMIEMLGNVPIKNFRAFIEKAKERDGGLYWLVGRFYVSAKDADLVFKIDSGIYSYESIGFAAARPEAVKDENGNLLWNEFDVTGLYAGEMTEGSWVFLGSQYGARTGKSAGSVKAESLGIDLDIEEVITNLIERLKPSTAQTEESKMMQFKIAGSEYSIDPEKVESVKKFTDDIEQKINDATAKLNEAIATVTKQAKILEAAYLKDATEEQAKEVAETAKAYRETLIVDALKYGQLTGAIPVDAEKAAMHRSILEKLTSPEIKETGEGYRAAWEKTNPPQGQIKARVTEDEDKPQVQVFENAPNEMLNRMPY
jgi:vacuolar-type H+-ATPase subunit H